MLFGANCQVNSPHRSNTVESTIPRTNAGSMQDPCVPKVSLLHHYAVPSMPNSIPSYNTGSWPEWV